MARTRDRKARLEAVERRIREVTRLTLVFSEQMASQLGVSTTDLECLNLVAAGSDVTAGALATRTGLTTGAITGAIDRLDFTAIGPAVNLVCRCLLYTSRCV